MNLKNIFLKSKPSPIKLAMRRLTVLLESDLEFSQTMTMNVIDLWFSVQKRS